VETKALRDAEFATDEAQAVKNNDVLALAAEDTNTTTAVGVANTDATAAFATAASYKGKVASGGRPFANAFNAALSAINAYGNNKVGAQFAPLEAAATKAVAARDAALGKLPAGHPAVADFATAIASQNAWFAAAKVRAAASLKLDASKDTLKTRTDAQTKVSDATGKTSKRLESFVKVVNDNRVPRLTQYAEDNWPAHPEEFFAEAYFLWITQPTYLTDNAPKLKAWFDAGNHLK
jgi:hypothetical protein